MAHLRSRRLVEHVRNDPFIDLAFVLPLIKNRDWLQVLRLQAEDFNITGDLGENTVTYRTYRSEVRSFIVSNFESVYEKSLESQLREELLKIKASRAWKALITLLASQQLMKKTGVGLGELLPETYERPEDLMQVVEAIIKEKTKAKGIAGTLAIRNSLKNFGEDKLVEIAPLLWWINLVMESEVFEGLFKYHLLVLRKLQTIKSVVKEIEATLSAEIREHREDADYLEHEILKALLSRCTELRGQYINKLQNATLFVKYLRRSVEDPDRWEWFLQNETLTYIMTVYITELQELSGLKQKNLNISSLITPRAEIYGGPPSALTSLILLSPIFMQYSIEARREVAVTPADILVALLRHAEASQVRDFSISVEELVKKIIEFWRERDFLRRAELYVGEGRISTETLCENDSLTISLALLINTGVGGISISTERTPILKLPPRMTGFDSLFVRPQQLLSAILRVWGGGWP
ncbi:MAG: hypothetical protein QXM12_08280 [Nitrososphaerota archaeon]